MASQEKRFEKPKKFDPQHKRAEIPDLEEMVLAMMEKPECSVDCCPYSYEFNYQNEWLVGVAQYDYSFFSRKIWFSVYDQKGNDLSDGFRRMSDECFGSVLHIYNFGGLPGLSAEFIIVPNSFATSGSVVELQWEYPALFQFDISVAMLSPDACLEFKWSCGGKYLDLYGGATQAEMDSIAGLFVPLAGTDSIPIHGFFEIEDTNIDYWKMYSDFDDGAKQISIDFTDAPSVYTRFKDSLNLDQSNLGVGDGFVSIEVSDSTNAGAFMSVNLSGVNSTMGATNTSETTEYVITPTSATLMFNDTAHWGSVYYNLPGDPQPNTMIWKSYVDGFIPLAGVITDSLISGIHPCDSSGTSFTAIGSDSYTQVLVHENFADFQAEDLVTGSLSEVINTPNQSGILTMWGLDHSEFYVNPNLIESTSTGWIKNRVVHGLHQGQMNLTDSTAITRVDDYATGESNYVEILPESYTQYLSTGTEESSIYSGPQSVSFNSNDLSNYESATIVLSTGSTPSFRTEVFDGNLGVGTFVEGRVNELRLGTPGVVDTTVTVGILGLVGPNGSVEFVQGVAVPNASGTVTVTDFNNLLNSLRGAGIIAP